MRIGY
jgi:hypothetical protein